MLTLDINETAKNIDRLRKEAGLSVKDIQIEFGFNTPQSIYKWIRGDSMPTLDNFVILADILNTTISNIVVTTEI